MATYSRASRFPSSLSLPEASAFSTEKRTSDRRNASSSRRIDTHAVPSEAIGQEVGQLDFKGHQLQCSHWSSGPGGRGRYSLMIVVMKSPDT